MCRGASTMRSMLNKFEHVGGRLGPVQRGTNGSYTLHGTGTGTWMGTIENNGSLSLSLSLCAVCTVHSII